MYEDAILSIDGPARQWPSVSRSRILVVNLGQIISLQLVIVAAHHGHAAYALEGNIIGEHHASYTRHQACP